MRTIRHVLIVEDNPGDADLAEDSLLDGEPVEISIVHDGSAAIQFLTQQGPFAGASRPDLVLLDLNLPGQHGTEVLQEIRGHEKLCDLPVVILSSSSESRDIASIYAEGANCYVVKPVGLRAYRQAMHEVKKFWFSVVQLP